MSQRKKRRKEREAQLSEERKHRYSSLKYLRISPRKVRAVVNTIRGRKVEDALAILQFTQRGPAVALEKMLRSAVANVANSDAADVDALVVKEIRVDQGPMLKRYLPRAMGRATMIQKKTSHVSCWLEEEK